MKILTTEQAGERLGLSASRVRHLILDGRIKAQKLGQINVIDEKEINRFKQTDRDRRRS